MRLTITDQDIQRKAIELRLIKEGEPVPPQVRSKVAAALLQEQAHAAPRETEARLAKEIVIQPDGVILVDGELFPWLVSKQPMEIGLNPEGISTVRMTLLTDAIQIIKPEADESEKPR